MKKNYEELKGIEEKGEETPFNKGRTHERQFPGEESLMNGNRQDGQAFEDQMSMMENQEQEQVERGPGERIVKDFRELSRQQGQNEANPSFLNGENVQQQEEGPPRYGDSISKNADKKFRDKEDESSSDWPNGRNYERDGNQQSSQDQQLNN